MGEENILLASATQQARALRERRLGCLELVELCLERIERVNPGLNAVVALCAERARDEARERDAALARGEPMGPLHGVSMTIKDSLDTAGLVTTAGTLGWRDRIPERDATVVARLRAAGAVLLGKSNTPELTLAFDTTNRVYGPTRNPFDPRRSPGGSSGGAAAIVCAGGVAFDVGSDTGGSVRQPAHLCGVAGLKPTSGRVPRTGHVIGFGGFCDSLTTLGPLARRVEDLELLLPILAGEDGLDPSVVPAPLRPSSETGLSRLRVAFYAHNGLAEPTRETRAAVETCAGSLAELGASVEEARPARLEESLPLLGAAIGADAPALRDLLERAGTREVSAELQGVLAAAAAPSDGGALRSMRARWDAFRVEHAAFMRERDAVLCPVNAHPAPLLERGMDGVSASYTMTYNLLGWPVAVVRVGTSPEGLPIGIQIAAPPWREEIALAIARHLEDAFGGWQAPPI